MMMHQQLALDFDMDTHLLSPEDYEQSLLEQLESPHPIITIPYSPSLRQHNEIFLNFTQNHLPQLACSCKELSISYEIEYDENIENIAGILTAHLNHIFNNLQYCVKLDKLTLNFTGNDEIEMPFNPIEILSKHLSKLTNLNILKHLSIQVPHTKIGDPRRVRHWMVDKILPYENSLLDFLNSCQKLTHFSICGNFLSTYFQDKLNTCLKNLPKLENVSLDYQATGADFKPISEILKNPSITSFSFTCANFWPTLPCNNSLVLESSRYRRRFELPAAQLKDAQQTLGQNRTLRHLVLDFKEAFDQSKLMASFDEHNPDVFITHHFLKFCSALTSMYHLENLVFHLPENLEEYLDSEEFKTNLLDCFKYTQGIDNMTILFTPLESQLSELRVHHQSHLIPTHQIMKNHFRHHCLFRESNYSNESLLQDVFPSLTLQEMKTTDMIRYDIAIFNYLSSYFHARKTFIQPSFLSKQDSNLFIHFCNGIIERLLSHNQAYSLRLALPGTFILSYLTPAEILKTTMSIGGLLRSQKSNWPALTTAPIIAQTTNKP